MLADYIKKEWVKLGAEAENWEEAIEEGGGLLLKDSVITQNYIEAMKAKNEIYYRNFHPESEAKDELTTIAKNVDGSKDVIRKRYEIYEGERK